MGTNSSSPFILETPRARPISTSFLISCGEGSAFNSIFNYATTINQFNFRSLSHSTSFQDTIEPTPVIRPPSLAVVGLARMRNPSALLRTISPFNQIKEPQREIQYSHYSVYYLGPSIIVLVEGVVMIFYIRMYERSSWRSPRSLSRISQPKMLFPPPYLLGLSKYPLGLAYTLWMKSVSAYSLMLSNSHSPTRVFIRIYISAYEANFLRTYGLASSVCTLFWLTSSNYMEGMDIALLSATFSLAYHERAGSQPSPNLQWAGRYTLLLYTTATRSFPQQRSPFYYRVRLTAIYLRLVLMTLNPFFLYYIYILA